MPIIPTTTED